MGNASYATGSLPSSPSYGGVGWLDFTGIALSLGVTVNVSTTLKDGSVVSLDVRPQLLSGGITSFSNLPCPVASYAALGNTGYTGIASSVRPVLSYQSSGNGSFRYTLSNISVTDPRGVAVPNFYFVVGDAEANTSSENAVYTTNGGNWIQLANLIGTGGGYSVNISGLGSSSVTIQGTNTTGPFNAYVVYTKNPTQVTFTINEFGGTGFNGAAFAVAVDKVSLNKFITNRFFDNDQFRLSVTGTTLAATTITYGATYGAQPVSAYVFGNNGDSYTLDESMAPGSTSIASQYTSRVAYTNLSAGGTAVPTSTTLPRNITLALGDIIVATVTNTILPVTVTSTKSVTKTIADKKDTLTYTIVLNNTGTVSAQNVVLIDTIPNNTTYQPSSLKLNGTPITGNPAPPSGINIGAIQANTVVTLTFDVVVDNTIPNPNPMVNTATGNFVYAVLPATVTSGYNTNAVSTRVNSAILSSIKSVDKAYANVGDTVSYAIRISNTGNVTATNILFMDTIPSGSALIGNKIMQDATNVTGSPNPPGIALPNPIPPGGVATVTFQVTVTTIPIPNPLTNNASMSYQYVIDSTTTPNRTGNDSTNTNSVTTQINNANVSSSKRVDKAFAKIGDTLLYTIVYTNAGNTSANNVILRDTIPSNTTFETNSVRINGVQQLGATVAPPTGLTVGTIPAGATFTVTFIVKVDTIPTPNPIPNNAATTYSYTVDPSLGTSTTGSTNTNQVTTRVNTAIVGTTKSRSISNGFVGDTILYTMVLRNSGNTTATDITLFDTIPQATIFVVDSVEVNGALRTGINPQVNGVTLPDLAVGGVATVTFRVVINTIPSPNPTTNASTTNYSYLLDSSTPTTTTASSNSNIVDTYVNPNTNPLKIVSQDHGTLGTTLTYTIVWRNVTNETQTNVIFVDTLPNGVTFIPNTLNVNGVTIAGGTITPPNGVNSGTLPVNSVATVTYQVVVNTIPTPNPIPNTASVTNTGVGGTQSFESNQVNTEINYAQLGVVRKSVDLGYAAIGETLLYTIVLGNTGNTTANTVVIKDTIPSGTTFEINTVTVDGINQPGAEVAPPTGLTLSAIPAGKVTTITFQVKVVSIPNPNRAINSANITNSFVVDPVIGTTQTQNNNTNSTTTTIIDATIVSVKAVNRTYANVGDTLIYTVTLAANGNTTANNVIFTDSLPSTVTYVPNSFAINGVSVPSGNPFSQVIGNLTVPAIYTITFNAVVNTIPNPNPIANTATTTFSFTVVPTLPNDRSRKGTSNTVNTNVNNASLGGITKSVDKTYADCGDTITYTINIPNSGNVTATNVVFKDTIPNGTVLQPTSVYVNGSQQPAANPATGITIGTIAPGATASVVFSVIVQC